MQTESFTLDTHERVNAPVRMRSGSGRLGFTPFGPFSAKPVRVSRAFFTSTSSSNVRAPSSSWSNTLRRFLNVFSSFSVIISEIFSTFLPTWRACDTRQRDEKVRHTGAGESQGFWLWTRTAEQGHGAQPLPPNTR